VGKKSKSGSGMNIPDHNFENLETIFWVKLLKFFDADPDLGSGNLLDPGSVMEKNCDPGSVRNIPDPQHCITLFNRGLQCFKLYGNQTENDRYWQKITFYFLQNVSKCTVFFAFAFKVCKKCYYDPKKIFL
jgi:hypothetical protein